MATDTAAPPDGFEAVQTSKTERQLVRQALKRFANDLVKEQRRNQDMGAANPIIDHRLKQINGTPAGVPSNGDVAGNLPGLIRRFMLDGDNDPPEAKADKKKKDPAQMDLTVGNGGAKGDRSIARGKISDQAAEEIKAAAKRGK